MNTGYLSVFYLKNHTTTGITTVINVEQIVSMYSDAPDVTHVHMVSGVVYSFPCSLDSFIASIEQLLLQQDPK